MGKIYRDDIGVEFRLNTGIPLDDAVDVKMVVRKPFGDVVEWNATKYGATQSLTYTVVDGDLDEVGIYYIQTYVDGHKGETFQQEVHAPYT